MESSLGNKADGCEWKQNKCILEKGYMINLFDARKGLLQVQSWVPQHQNGVSLGNYRICNFESSQAMCYL